MFSNPKPIQQRVDSLKTRLDKHFYALGLRDDFAQLIEAGLQRAEINQRELAKVTKYSESYISRLANAGTNFKIGVVARVLVAMGIVPMIVDKAEFDRLREVERRSTAHGITARNTTTANRIIASGSDSAYIIGAATGTTSSTYRIADVVGGSCPVCPEQVTFYRGRGVRMPVVLP